MTTREKKIRRIVFFMIIPLIGFLYVLMNFRTPKDVDKNIVTHDTDNGTSKPKF